MDGDKSIDRSGGGCDGSGDRAIDESNARNGSAIEVAIEQSIEVKQTMATDSAME